MKKVLRELLLRLIESIPKYEGAERYYYQYEEELFSEFDKLMDQGKICIKARSEEEAEVLSQCLKAIIVGKTAYELCEEFNAYDNEIYDEEDEYDEEDGVNNSVMSELYKSIVRCKRLSKFIGYVSNEPKRKCKIYDVERIKKMLNKQNKIKFKF